MWTLDAGWFVLRWTLPAVLAVAAAIGWLVWRWRARPEVVLQAAAIGLVGLALSRPAIRSTDQPTEMLVAVDRSASVGVQGRRAAETISDKHPRVYFAEGIARSPVPPRAAATHLRPVLDMAMGEHLAGRIGGLVLLSDGRFTDRWRAAADALGRAGMDVVIVPLDRAPRDGRVGDFAAVARDGRAELTVTLQANTPQRRGLVLRRGRTGPIIARRDVILQPNTPTTLRFGDDLLVDQPVRSWQVELTPPDALPSNDAMTAILQTPLGESPVVIAPPDRSANLLAATRTVVRGAEALSPIDAPTHMAGWRRYTAVVLADTSLSRPAQTSLVEFVRSGGGLVLLGRSAGDTPLAEVAALIEPASARQPVDLTVVLDASGSMARQDSQGRRRRFELAADALGTLQEHLRSTDRLRVIRFNQTARLLVDGSADAATFDALARQLAAVQPVGPTRIGEALTLATDQPTSPEWVSLVLVLSDLQTAPFEAAGMAERFRQGGHRLAVVAITDEPTAPVGPLDELADRLGARFVLRRSLLGVAELLDELAESAGQPAVRQGETITTAENSPSGDALAAIGRPVFYWPSEPADTADVTARLAETHAPLMAYRRAGLGRVMSLVLAGSSLADLPQAVPAAMLLRVAGYWPPRVEGRLVREGESVTLLIRPVNPSGFEGLQANLLDPGETNAPRTVTLEQTGGSQWSARFDWPVDRPVAVQVRDDGGKVIWQGMRAGGYPPEYRALGADWSTLRTLAVRAGGRIVREGQLAAALPQRRLQRMDRPIWYIPAGLALLAMLVGWCVSGLRAADLGPGRLP
jgi:hypothetical protein